MKAKRALRLKRVAACCQLLGAACLMLAEVTQVWEWPRG